MQRFMAFVLVSSAFWSSAFAAERQDVELERLKASVAKVQNQLQRAEQGRRQSSAEVTKFEKSFITAETKVKALEQQISQIQQRLNQLEAQTTSDLETRLSELESLISKTGSTVTIGGHNKIVLSTNTVEVQAAKFKANVPVAEFFGNIKGVAITVDSVASKTYTPGAGNIQ